MLGRQLDLGLPLDQLLGAAPVGDQVLDRAELEAVLLAELDEVGHARHRAVLLHDLADHAGRRQAREPREVDRALGLARALERAAGARAQREDVAGLHDVARAHAGIDRDLDRAGAVARRDAGLDALARLDRDGERGLVRRLVVRHHQAQAELVAALRGQRQADQAAAVRRHEVDRLGRHELGGHARDRPRSRGPGSRRRRPSRRGGWPRLPPRSGRTARRTRWRQWCSRVLPVGASVQTMLPAGSSGKQALDVLGDHVHLEIDVIPHLEVGHGGRCPRVRDQRDLEAARRRARRRSG